MTLNHYHVRIPDTTDASCCRSKLPAGVPDNNIPEVLKGEIPETAEKYMSNRHFFRGKSSLGPNSGDGCFTDKEWDKDNTVFNVFGTFHRTITPAQRRTGRFILVCLTEEQKGGMVWFMEPHAACPVNLCNDPKGGKNVNIELVFDTTKPFYHADAILAVATCDIDITDGARKELFFSYGSRYWLPLSDQDPVEGEEETALSFEDMDLGVDVKRLAGYGMHMHMHRCVHQAITIVLHTVRR